MLWVLYGSKTLPQWVNMEVVEWQKGFTLNPLVGEVLDALAGGGLCVYYNGVHMFEQHTGDGYMVPGCKVGR